MTKVQRHYSRVYWEALDDPKFALVWADDRALAAWLRLLVAADMAWPASASLYHGIHRGGLRSLTDAGLVDMQPSGRYRIHGLDREREARSGAARDAINARWDNPDGVPPMSDDDYRPDTPVSVGKPARSTEGIPSQDEPSKAEQSRAKPSRARADGRAPEDALGLMVEVEALTGQPFGWSVGSRICDTLTGDVAAFGAVRVLAEYRAVRESANGSPVDAAQLVFGAHKAMFPIADSKPKPVGKGGVSAEEAIRAFNRS